MDEIIIRTNAIQKCYPLYDNNKDRMLEALSLTRKKRHRDFFALNGVTFDVKRGETVGIIGTNGSGKSTLLKILTGVVTPTGGSFEVNGKISALLELGAGFNMEYTGLQNIYLNGTIMGYTHDEMEERIQGIIDFADIGEFLNQPVKNYSSGMFARLAFSVAINVEPDVLIIDEALSVGDMAFQNKCFRKFSELCERGVTILFVSHGLDTVRQMCDRVLWIEHGEQRMFGDSETVCNAFFDEQTKKRDTYYTTNDNPEPEHVQTQERLECPKLLDTAEGIRSEDVEILSVFMTDKKGVPVQEIVCGRTYTFHAVISAHIDLRDLIFGVTFDTSHGLVTFGENTLHSTDSNFSMKAGETLEIQLKFDIPYIRGEEYLLEIAVSQGSQDSFRALTWLHSAQKIKVIRPGSNLAVCHPAHTETNFFVRKSVNLY